MILVLAALMLVALLSFAALAVDVGLIAATRAQLQTITDAAALAGARQLATEARLSSTYSASNILANEVPAATAKAIAVGNANSVGGQLAALTSGNIVVGYINDNLQSPNLATAIDTSSPLTFNSVRQHPSDRTRSDNLQCDDEPRHDHRPVYVHPEQL
jgi:uncharacterized membrane protein